MEKPIEYRQYADVKTGEVFDVPVIHHETKGNKDFEMIFYGHFLEILNDLGNKKIQILRHLIKNREKANNTFIGTVRDIGNSLNIGLRTVQETLVLLEDKGAIKRRTGIVYIDADLVCDGRFKDRIMHIYNNLEDENAEEKKARILREIERKKKEIERLEELQSI